MKIKRVDFQFIHIKCVLSLLLCLILLAGSCPLSVSAQNGSGKVVRVGWFDTTYNIKDAAGRRTGYSYDYQRKIAAYTGWRYVYVEGSWNELMEKLINGEIDLMSDVSYMEERAQKMLYSSYSMGTEEYYLYISEKNVDAYKDDYSFLNGKKVGANKASFQEKCFIEWAKEHDVKVNLIEQTCSETESIRMLADGTLDGYVSLDNYTSEEKIVPVAKVGYSDCYFAVSNQRKDLLLELDEAMSKIQDENRFYSRDLYVKYFLNSGASSLFLSTNEMKWLSSHPTIRVGYLDNFLAYCDTDKKTKKLTGALKDYLEDASDCLANAKLNFEPVAFSTVDEALQAVREGKVDCMFPAGISNYDGEETALFLSPSITRSTLFMLVRSDDQRPFTADEQVKTAIESGDANKESFIKEYYSGWERVMCTDAQECLDAVAEGRADCFLLSSYRYNNLRKLIEKHHLATVETGKDVEFCFAVKEGNTELYSIFAKTINVIPETQMETALTHYFSEESAEKYTLLDFIWDNLYLVVTVLVVIAAMLMLIIVQNRLIKAEKKARENRRIADDLSRRVYVDALTSVRNKGGYTDYIRMLQERLDNHELTEFAIVMFDCDDLKTINDKYGHDKGDIYLKVATHLICQTFLNSPVFRIGGDEFTSILQNDDFWNYEGLISKFESESQKINEAAADEWEQVNVSVGIAVYDPKTDHSVEDTACRADQQMYENKRKRKAGGDIR